MTLNASEKWEGSLANSSPSCNLTMSDWEHQIEKMYTYFYLVLFVPGLLLNTMALWVLCKYIRYTNSMKHTKASSFLALPLVTWVTVGTG